jgi:hypothetical protein
MRITAIGALIPLALFAPGPTVAQDSGTSAGSGVVIGVQGEIITNHHVVESCAKITVQFPSKKLETATVVARDQKNDLAALRVNASPTAHASFREGAPVRAGDPVVALGYPLSGLLATSANISVGNVSALAGLGDDTRYLQISAPVQPGNSGGPLLDGSGHLVGIVTAKLNAMRVARYTGDIPQNVNFAIKAEIAKAFLDSNGIGYGTIRSDQTLSPADIGDAGRAFTVYIECQRAAPRVALPIPTKKSQQQSSLAAAKRFPETGQIAFVLNIGDDWVAKPDNSGNMILRPPGNFAGLSLSVIQDKASATASRDEVASAILAAATAQPFYKHEPSSIGSVKAEAYYSTMVNASKVNLDVKLIIVQIAQTHVATLTVITAANRVSAAQQKSLDDLLKGVTLTGVK